MIFIMDRFSDKIRRKWGSLYILKPEFIFFGYNFPTI